MELVLVRHALPMRSAGHADPGLSERGQAQAHRLADALRADRIDALYTSPARRARETAAPVEAALDMVAHTEPGLAEFDTGDDSYVPIEELRAAGDPRWHAVARGDLYSAGVDPDDFRTRVAEACRAIAARHPGGRAVLFTHAGVCNALLGEVLGQQRPIWYAPAYCSLQRVAIARDGRQGVVSLNETLHVRDLLDAGPPRSP